MSHERPEPSPAAWVSFGLGAAALLALSALTGSTGPIGEAALELGWLGAGRVSIPSGRFVLLHGGLWAASLAVFLTVPRGLGFRREASLVILLSLACHLLLIPLPHGDDLNRYMWEGRLLAEGLSPYVHAAVQAGDPVADHLRTAADPFWEGINHPEMTAIYPPLMLGLFAAVGAVSYTATALKLVFLACSMAALWILLGLLERRGLPARYGLLYGASPIVLISFAGQGHLDVVQVLCILAALSLYHRRRHGWLFVLLGLAFQVKYVALLCWPFFVRRENARYLPLALLVAGGPLAWFLVRDGAAVFESFVAFGGQMAWNGSIHALLRELLGGIEPASALCQALYAALWLAGFAWFRPGRRRSPYTDPASGVFFALGALIVLSPTVHTWYLSWVVPLVALRPTASWVLLALTIGIAFAAEGMAVVEGSWGLPPGAGLAIWAPPLAMMLAVDLPRFVTRSRRWRGPGPIDEGTARAVTVVVPTLNEEERISRCLEAVLAEPAVAQIVVVDAGSTDSTRSVARDVGVEVILHDASFDDGGGRGGQIARGFGAARCELVAIVHADTLLEPGALSRAADHLARSPDVSGAALGSVFEGRGAHLRVVEGLNDVRAAMLGISFGDQIQVVRRDAVVPPSMPLMEDVELSLRMQRAGRVSYLFGSSLVSPRRWQEGAGKRALLVIALTAEFLLRRLAGPVDTVPMYRRYYRR